MLQNLVRVFREEGFHGIRMRMGVKAALRIRPAIVTSRYDIRLKGNWDDLTFRFYVMGAYGYYLSDLLRSMRDDFVFMDIGANQGLYSILASKNRACTRVHAFEPVPDVAGYLKANLELNKCGNVLLREVAISDRSGTFPMGSNPLHSGSASLRNDSVAGDGVFLRTIECISRDELAGMEGQDGCRIFVKIDVEGFEETVLREVVACPFFSRVQDVFYEVDENWVDPEQLASILRSCGFSSFRKIGAGQHYDVHATRPQHVNAGNAVARLD